MRSGRRNTIYAAMALTMLSVGNWAEAVGDVSITFNGDFITAIENWWHYQPSPEVVRATVPTLATKLANLAGLNGSLASAMLSDGPVNQSWMYASLDTIREKNQDIIGAIENIDPNFGAQHTDIIQKLSASINEKIRLLDTQGNGIELTKQQDRKAFGQVLQQEAQILQRLSENISAAQAQPH